MTTPNTHRPTSRLRRTMVLAAAVSLVAAVAAAFAHLVFDVGEQPLVIATLVAGSVFGWRNAERSSRSRVTRLPARHLHRAA